MDHLHIDVYQSTARFEVYGGGLWKTNWYMKYAYLLMDGGEVHKQEHFLF